MPRLRFPLAVLWLVLAASAGRQLAAQPPAEGAAPADGKPDDAKDDARLKEQSIYIPYAKLREVFETQGRGVFLPYEKFQDLWRAAREKTAPAGEQRPPVDSLITEAAHTATVGRDVVEVKAKIKIELLTEGWQTIPLYLADAAITSARIGDAPARVVADPAIGYKLLIHKKGREPQEIELTLEYAKAINKSPGQNSVTFQAPRAPVSRWQVQIAEPGVKVNVHPLIAATEMPADAAQPQQTVILAFVGAAEHVQIDWTPRTEGAMGLEALATVQVQQEATVEEGVARTRVALNYDISRAQLTGVVLEAPADQRVVNVFDANVRQWNVAEEGNLQIITVEFFEPAKTRQSITVELEKFTTEEAQQEVSVPVVKARGVGRQQGTVLVRIGGGLRGEAIRHTGLLQIDSAEMTSAAPDAGGTFAYRYAALPFDLRLRVEKIEPRIVVETLTEAWLEPDRLSIDVQAVYTIERAGVFRLEWELPGGFEVRSVRGQPVAGAEPVSVDGFAVEGEESKRLVVNLSRKAMGRVGLAIELQRRLDEPDLLSPTGKAATIGVAVPQPPLAGIERSSGRVVVQAPQSLRLNPAKTDGLRSVSFQEAYGSTASLRNPPPGGARPVLAYAHAQERVALELTAERRKPSVNAEQLLTVRVEAGVAHFRAAFAYKILYSAVKSLRIDVPKDLAPLIHNETSTIHEKPIEPAPDDVAAGYIAWALTGETELIGDVNLLLTWEQKLDKLEVGKPVDLAVPRLVPAGVDLAKGQIALLKTESIDVHESGTPRGLRPIDPEHDLTIAGGAAGAARAFEFQDDWALTVSATMYQLEEIKSTSIERAVVRMVVTRGNVVPVQAIYRIRSAQQRLIVKLPGGAQFDTLPLHLNGLPATLERGNADEFYVPLVGQSPDAPFLLELRYTVPGGGARLDLPEFPADAATQTVPAVQKLYLCAYLPEEWSYLGSQGPWTEELNWYWQELCQVRVAPRSGATDGELMQWVTQGIALPPNTNPLASFPTDGRLYTFSTMRPEPAPGGSLRLTTMREQRFKLLVFLAVAVGGLLLLGAGGGRRILATGAVVAVLVLVGVFAPTLSRQLLSWPLVAAVAVVSLLWIVRFVAGVWPLATARMNTAPAAAASPFAAAPAADNPPPPAAESPPPAAPNEPGPPEGGQNNG